MSEVANVQGLDLKHLGRTGLEAPLLGKLQIDAFGFESLILTEEANEHLRRVATISFVPGANCYGVRQCWTVHAFMFLKRRLISYGELRVAASKLRASYFGAQRK